MRIADEAQHRFGRKVSWGASCGDQTVWFTTLAAPAMTRLRMPERRVLDTLVDAGVARSRSHALAWCVRLVAERQDDWLKDLRGALESVEKVRAEGPEGLTAGFGSGRRYAPARRTSTTTFIALPRGRAPPRQAPATLSLPKRAVSTVRSG